MDWRGMDWLGMAGVVWHGGTRHGKARSGRARQARNARKEKRMVYKWEGYKYNVSANIVGAHCEAIEARNGKVTSKDLVDDARDESSELHSLFEWDDAIAGEKYRRNQAQTILAALKIVIEDKPKEAVTVKAFVNVSPEPRSNASYVNVKAALENEEHKNAVLANAKRELYIVRMKYNTLAELSKVWAAIDEAMEV